MIRVRPARPDERPQCDIQPTFLAIGGEVGLRGEERAGAEVAPRVVANGRATQEAADTELVVDPSSYPAGEASAEALALQQAAIHLADELEAVGQVEADLGAERQSNALVVHAEAGGDGGAEAPVGDGTARALLGAVKPDVQIGAGRRRKLDGRLLPAARQLKVLGHFAIAQLGRLRRKRQQEEQSDEPLTHGPPPTLAPHWAQLDPTQGEFRPIR